MDEKLKRTICRLSFILFVITEGLGLFNLLTRQNIILCWGLVTVAFFVIKGKPIIGNIKFHKPHFVRIDIIALLELSVCIALCIIMLIMSIKTVPNNYDSMTYHLPRIANWIQNKNTNYYITNSIRQLYSPVFAEYVMMHVMLITQSDILVNAVQWLSYCVNAYLIFSICGKLNMDKHICYVGSIIFLTMPMAVAQSVTTQVDLVGTMWLLIFIDYVIVIAQRKSLKLDVEAIKMIVGCALSIAFGYLTKSNVCYPMIVMLLWLLIVRIKHKDKISVIAALCVIAFLTVFVLVLPTFIRNYIDTGSILAMNYMSGIMIGTFKPSLFFMNVYKNMALLLSTGFLDINVILVKTGVILSNILKVDLNDPSISLTRDFAGELPVSYHHDAAPNPFIAWLFIITVLIWAICVVFKRIRNNRLFYFLFVLSIMTMICFLRYQVWGSRLMLPACAMMCIFVSYMFDEMSGFLSARALTKKFSLCNHTAEIAITSKTILSCMTVILCIYLVIPAVKYQKLFIDIKNVYNKSRFEMYFENKGDETEYSEICNYVKSLGCKNIGLLLGNDSYEYPLWTQLKNGNTYIVQVVPGNKTDVIPDCIAAIDQNYPYDSQLDYAGCKYKCIWNYEDNPRYAVLQKE